ncbi:hypothetical protein AXG93_1478s1110 [Marchantia polymorpha subsp. ruderalis]|uniref:Uncharacterized protein n=1 Tax=Marchantia polymorpha subsp. ruderalis TaxID=1480154 RepID=A0A176VKS8_MARPO|nr:hypothetical protein AXG93_1478s1110 [Marchantia polymorpha subsp. ruderalis]
MTWLDDYWPSWHSDDSSAAPKVEFNGTKISDSVYDLRPMAEQVEDWDVELVFFHGLLLEQNKLDEAYFRTWVTNTIEPQCWPATILTKDFPKARVLSVNLDGAVKKAAPTGRNDMDNVVEILVAELIRNTRPFGAGIGQTGTPVIFVTHCLGALVAQKLIMEVDKQITQRGDLKLKSFWDNLGGVVYYSPPFYGSEQFMKATNSIKSKGPLVSFMDVLCKDNAKIVQTFDELLTSERFSPSPRKLGGFNGQVSEEAAARTGEFVTVEGDHYTVCQPEDETSLKYQHLASFAQEIVQQYVARHRPLALSMGGAPGPSSLISQPVEAVANAANETQQIQTKSKTSLEDQVKSSQTADGQALFKSASKLEIGDKLQNEGAKRSGLAAQGRRLSDLTFFDRYD